MRHALAFGLAAWAVIATLAQPAGAVLAKFRLNRTLLAQSSEFPDRVPNCSFGWGPAEQCEGKALVDQSGSAAVLRRFEFITDTSGTIPGLPGCCVRLYLSLNQREGPTGSATGSGSTAAGSTLRWGSVTGWSISGTTWCNSFPAVVCTLALAMDEASSDPAQLSSFYDLGTWSFHGTGFTSVPFVAQTFTNSSGNNMLIYRGARVNDSSVPALPAAALLALGALLAGGAASALRRGPPPER